MPTCPLGAVHVACQAGEVTLDNASLFCELTLRLDASFELITCGARTVDLLSLGILGLQAICNC